MPAQTFTLTNTGSAASQLDRIVFNTPAGLSHTADLTNFGGPANFTGTSFTVVNPTLGLNQSKTFTLDYSYVSGTAGARNGSVTVFYVGGQSCAAQTTINVGQSTATYAVTPDRYSANEGDIVTFAVTTTNVSNGTTLWWAAFGYDGATQPDASNPIPPQGSFVVNSNSGSFTITIAQDQITPESGEKFAVRLYPSEGARNDYGPGLVESAKVTIIDTTPGAPVPQPTPSEPAPTPSGTINITATNDNHTLGEAKLYTITTSLPAGTILYTRILSSGGTPPAGASSYPRAQMSDFLGANWGASQATVFSVGGQNTSFAGVNLVSPLSSPGPMWYVFRVGTSRDPVTGVPTGLTADISSWINKP